LYPLIVSVFNNGIGISKLCLDNVELSGKIKGEYVETGGLGVLEITALAVAGSD
jgi:hypothetical protein